MDYQISLIHEKPEKSLDLTRLFEEGKISLLLGRDGRKCQLVVDSPFVSRVQCEFEYHAPEAENREHYNVESNTILSVRELGSLNGVFVNHAKITPEGIFLRNGDIFNLGGVLEYRVDISAKVIYKISNDTRKVENE